MPMDFNYTLLDDNFEDYCIAMMKLIEKLPDTVFSNENLSPSSSCIDLLINYSKNMSQ